MNHKQKLELTWIGKEKRPKLEPRILLEDPNKSYHAKHRITEDDIFDNRLIFGDNLLALKALEQEFSGKVSCVFIDPPYNTGSAFEHYDDGLEHSIWLGLIRDRLEVIRRLLSNRGSLWITIDDNEAHYLKIICDEIFGRQNFVGNALWEKADSPRMDAQFFSVRHDHLLVYAKDMTKAVWNRLSTGGAPDHYDRIDTTGRKYYLKPLRAMGGRVTHVLLVQPSITHLRHPMDRQFSPSVKMALMERGVGTKVKSSKRWIVLIGSEAGAVGHRITEFTQKKIQPDPQKRSGLIVR